MKEYDLVRELGRGNWVDAIAGEAMVLGYSLCDPQLELMGADLAKAVREIRYDSDKFSLVEAKAMRLVEVVRKAKSEEGRGIYIDSIPEGENLIDSFQYDFLEIGGSYQITITLYEFTDSQLLHDSLKVEIENKICSCLTDPSMASYQKEESEVIYPLNNQKFVTTQYSNSGQLVRKIIINDHQDKYSKGFKETFYFDDFGEAIKAWEEVRKVAILGQTR